MHNADLVGRIYLFRPLAGTKAYRSHADCCFEVVEGGPFRDAVFGRFSDDTIQLVVLRDMLSMS
jgi:hypothetical protein